MQENGPVGGRESIDAMMMKISEIHIQKRTRKDMGDIAALAASINEIGLLHCPVVNPAGDLLVGARRVQAFRELGRTEIPVRIVKNLDEAILAVKAERDENTCRKDFSPTEAVSMGERLEQLLRPEAEKRKQGAGNFAGRGRPKIAGGNLPQAKTRDAVGSAVGMSGKTYQKAKAVVEAAKAEPELIPVVEEMDRTGNVDRASKKIKRHNQKKEHAARVKASSEKPKTEIKGPFDLVLADPPWKYEHCEADTRQIENQYPTMALPAIFNDHPDSKTDSILFLWATAPKLDEALQVMRAWGFNYRSCAVWDKEKIGMGYWWRIQHELLLVGVRGEPRCTPECARVASIFRQARTKHSVKPACVYEWIESAFPEAVKLEMYCRKPRPGWAVSGNECYDLD